MKRIICIFFLIINLTYVQLGAVDNNKIIYKYYSGGMPSNYYINIDIIISPQSITLFRKHTPVNQRFHSKNIKHIIKLKNNEYNKFYKSLLSLKFYQISTKRTMIYDRNSEIIHVFINDRKYSFGETPVLTINNENNKKRFYQIVKSIFTFVKTKLPKNKHWLLRK